ncbi:MAG: radical SAM protein [Bacteroidota bacterium]
MRKLRIGVIDLVSQGPTTALWARVMNANLSSIMPQVVAVWCKQAGHEVTLLCYTGFEQLDKELPGNLDLVFIGAFTESALVAYALSNRFHAQGTVTALGGPHARCYPEDAQKHFDYVLGFTDEAVIGDVLTDCSHHHPLGVRLSAPRQAQQLPGVRDRWEFMEPTLRKAPLIQVVPMLASVGCPYTCSFCIDSTVPYQRFDGEILKADLRFLRSKFKRPLVGWHDPNFGVQFDAIMDSIEEAVPPDSIDFIAESSLSLLSEPHLRRLKRNGFKALLPGIESWFELGEKSRARSVQGEEKVKRVAEHVNLILRYIPYVQTNFVMGLDTDSGPEPFELTKRFVDLAPGAFPGYSLLTAFGAAAPINLEYQRENRVLAFPFHFLNNNGAMNLRPKHYAWPDFYQHVIDLTGYTFSLRAILRRMVATRAFVPRWLNVVRAISSEGYGRIRYHRQILHLLQSDTAFRGFFEQETDTVPRFYIDRIRKDLGPIWASLPEGAFEHDQNAYLRSHVRGDGTATFPGQSEESDTEARVA